MASRVVASPDCRVAHPADTDTSTGGGCGLTPSGPALGPPPPPSPPDQRRVSRPDRDKRVLRVMARCRRRSGNPFVKSQYRDRLCIRSGLGGALHRPVAADTTAGIAPAAHPARAGPFGARAGLWRDAHLLEGLDSLRDAAEGGQRAQSLRPHLAPPAGRQSDQLGGGALAGQDATQPAAVQADRGERAQTELQAEHVPLRRQ